MRTNATKTEKATGIASLKYRFTALAVMISCSFFRKNLWLRTNPLRTKNMHTAKFPSHSTLKTDRDAKSSLPAAIWFTHVPPKKRAG